MKPLVTFVALMAFGSSASADFADAFESYANFEQLAAPGAWGDFAAMPHLGTALMNSGGNPGKFVFHPGGATLKHELVPLSSTATHSIVWQFDLFIEAGGTPQHKRMTNGLRVEGTTTILEMGIHNNNLNPENGSIVLGYAIRTVSIGGTPNNWACFPGNPAIQPGWNRFRATIKPTQILFELDFQADGVFDTSRLVITSNTSAIGWNCLRIGGPSDVSSLGGGAGFDNLSIQLVANCPADIAPTPNGDGFVDADDLLAVIENWGPCLPQPATCPQNIVTTGVSANQVDVNDMLAVILGWGDC